jgi:hypothetical protein
LNVLGVIAMFDATPAKGCCRFAATPHRHGELDTGWEHDAEGGQHRVEAAVLKRKGLGVGGEVDIEPLGACALGAAMEQRGHAVRRRHGVLARPPRRLAYGGGGARTKLVCGYLACDHRLARMLLPTASSAPH